MAMTKDPVPTGEDGVSRKATPPGERLRLRVFGAAWNRLKKASDASQPALDAIGAIWSVVWWVALAGIPAYVGLTSAMVSAQGASECRSALTREAPEFIATHVVNGTMWAREYEGHWIAAVRAEPRSLSADGPVTVICHFAADGEASSGAGPLLGRDLDFSHFEVLDGDRLDHLKTVSTWVWFPLTS